MRTKINGAIGLWLATISTSAIADCIRDKDFAFGFANVFVASYTCPGFNPMPEEKFAAMLIATLALDPAKAGPGCQKAVEQKIVVARLRRQTDQGFCKQMLDLAQRDKIMQDMGILKR